MIFPVLKLLVSKIKNFNLRSLINVIEKLKILNKKFNVKKVILQSIKMWILKTLKILIILIAISLAYNSAFGYEMLGECMMRDLSPGNSPTEGLYNLVKNNRESCENEIVPVVLEILMPENYITNNTYGNVDSSQHEILQINASIDKNFKSAIDTNDWSRDSSSLDEIVHESRNFCNIL